MFLSEVEFNNTAAIPEPGRPGCDDGGGKLAAPGPLNRVWTNKKGALGALFYVMSTALRRVCGVA